jgi:hypothetical protein
MKLSIEDYKTKYAGLITRTKVYLNEEELKYCIEASDNDGYAVIYKTGPKGEIPRSSNLEKELKKGKVEFRYFNGSGPGISEEEWGKLIEEKRSE